jgi:hypothetical protein
MIDHGFIMLLVRSPNHSCSRDSSIHPKLNFRWAVIVYDGTQDDNNFFTKGKILEFVKTNKLGQLRQSSIMAAL